MVHVEWWVDLRKKLDICPYGIRSQDTGCFIQLAGNSVSSSLSKAGSESHEN